MLKTKAAEVHALAVLLPCSTFVCVLRLSFPCLVLSLVYTLDQHYNKGPCKENSCFSRPADVVIDGKLHLNKTDQRKKAQFFQALGNITFFFVQIKCFNCLSTCAVYQRDSFSERLTDAVYSHRLLCHHYKGQSCLGSILSLSV